MTSTAAVTSASSWAWVGQQVTFAAGRRSPEATVHTTPGSAGGVGVGLGNW